jgi:hypothetical protein
MVVAFFCFYGFIFNVWAGKAKNSHKSKNFTNAPFQFPAIYDILLLSKKTQFKDAGGISK